MRDYKRWTAKQRWKSLEGTNAAIARGELPKTPRSCEHCKQTEGLLMWHNDNYDHPTKYLVGVCWRCHLVFYHCDHINADACRYYRLQVAAGRQYPPIYRQDFSILARENGVTKWRKFDPAKLPEPKAQQKEPKQQSFNLDQDKEA